MPPIVFKELNMIAKVRSENELYDSIVFAIYKKGWASEVLVFNRNYTALQFVKIWIPDRNVFIYNAEKNGWIIKKKIEGYDWILENVNRKFFKTKINEAILDKCKELQATVNECEWLDINNKIDVDGLIYASLDFHDSYIKNMYTDNGKQYIHFNTTWGCEILFELDGKVKTNLFKHYGAIAKDNEYSEIFESAMFFQDNLIYWVDDGSVTNADEIQKKNSRYFYAEKVKWKLIIDDIKIWCDIKQ